MHWEGGLASQHGLNLDAGGLNQGEGVCMQGEGGLHPGGIGSASVGQWRGSDTMGYGQ